MSKQIGRSLAEGYESVWKSSKVTRPAPTRPPHEQIVAAAWGNVAAENPKVTLGDAKRAIKKTRP